MPEETTSTAAAGTEGTEKDPFEDPKVEQFGRDYVEKLRRENAEHRTARKSAESVWEGWTKEDREIWETAVKTAARDPKAGRDRLVEIANLLYQEQQQEEKGGKAAAEEPKTLTAEDVDKLLEKRLESEREKSAVDAEVRKIEREAEKLGYSQKEDPEAYYRLLWIANNQTDLDLKKADAKIKADRQKVIDDYVEDRRSKRDGYVKVPGGNRAGEEKKIRTLQDASEATAARIRAARGEID